MMRCIQCLGIKEAGKAALSRAQHGEWLGLEAVDMQVAAEPTADDATAGRVPVMPCL